MKIIDFKTVSPLFEQERDGEKPFTVRKRDPKDKRFRALSQLGWGNKGQGWLIRITNPATGESFIRRLYWWDYIRDTDGLIYNGTHWIILFLGGTLE